MIPIMIVGEDLVRGALAAVLAHESDLEVVSELPPDADLAAAVRRHRPAVVVVDIDRYGSGGMEAAGQVVAQLSVGRVLLLSGDPTPDLVRRALAAGVWGVASADTSLEQLAQIIRAVADGERVLDHALAAAALRPVENPLTEQERMTLALAGEGLRSREIAERLFLSPGTVRNYLSAAIRKTGARNRLGAVQRARREGWL